MSVHENEDPIFGIDTVPFLATSYPAAKKLWDASRPAVEKKLDSQGLKLLFAVPWPPQGLFSKTAVTKVEDLKGVKWRAYNPAPRASPPSSGPNRSRCSRPSWPRRWPPASSPRSSPPAPPAMT